MDPFEQAVLSVRFLSADGVEQAKSGHPGTAMALAGVAVEIFARHLRYQPDDPAWPNRDRFVLSCGHAGMLLYSTLHLAGFDVPLDELKQFRQWGAKTAGHPEHGMLPGVETSTGPLGAGISNGVGMALASKMMGARVSEGDAPLIDYSVYVICSEGDLMEGVSSEASSFAGHLGLDNLIVVYDDNRISIDGSTDMTFTEDVGKRYEAYGWFVQRVDGHAQDEVRQAIEAAKAERGRPSIIVAKTHIAYGAPTKQDTSAAHGAPLGRQELDEARRAVGWPLEPFHVGPEAKQPFLERVAQVRPEYEAWQRRVSSLTGAARELYLSHVEHRMPADLYARLTAAVPAKQEASRSTGGKVLNAAALDVPCLVQGAADLAASTNTMLKDSPPVVRGEFVGRNIYYGVREHAMGSIMNGLALSGFFIPVGSTFMVFADYMRPTLRLAALMKQRSIFVFTHDSIFVGEDGPTHQPVEQLAALRVIPNLHVLRPADALECAAAWAHALEREDGPCVLSLSRQAIPPLQRASDFDPEAVRRGAYILSDTPDPTLVLIATGSEVHVAEQAKPLLEAKGARVRVVSAPCWELFSTLPASEQEAVVGRGIRRVAVEAGVGATWRGAVGLDGIVVGIERFGISAPAGRLAEEFGLTAERVAERIQAAL